MLARDWVVVPTIRARMDLAAIPPLRFAPVEMTTKENPKALALRPALHRQKKPKNPPFLRRKDGAPGNPRRHDVSCPYRTEKHRPRKTERSTGEAGVSDQ